VIGLKEVPSFIDVVLNRLKTQANGDVDLLTSPRKRADWDNALYPEVWSDDRG